MLCKYIIYICKWDIDFKSSLRATCVQNSYFRKMKWEKSNYSTIAIKPPIFVYKKASLAWYKENQLQWCSTKEKKNFNGARFTRLRAGSWQPDRVMFGAMLTKFELTLTRHPPSSSRLELADLKLFLDTFLEMWLLSKS